MAIVPFLSTLTLSARTAYPIIRKGVNEGLSSRTIATVLKDQGLGIRRQTLLDIMRAEKDVQTKGSQLKFLPANRRPNPARLGKALTPIYNRYGFEVRVTGYQPATGLTEQFYITVGTDDLLTRGQIEQTAMDILTADPSKYPINIEQVQLINGFTAGDLGLRPRGI